MTYRARPGGRQFIVIAAGGHAGLRSRLGDHVVAFALPDDGRRTGRASSSEEPRAPERSP